MDSILEVKEALAARSKVASLDELKSQGRKLVKLIRAEHIAAMVHEAVQKALAGTGMMSKEDVDRLVERSKHEFQDVMQERQQEIDRLRTAMRQVEQLKAGRVQLEASLQQISGERDQLREMIDHSRGRELEHARVERERNDTRREMERMQKALAQAEEQRDDFLARVRQLESESDGRGGPSGAGSQDLSSDLVFRLMNEVAALKAGIGDGGRAARPAAGAAPADPGITAALEKLAGTLNERLDKFGRKIGISSAIEAPDVKLDGLFSRDTEQLESNMDSVQVKTKTGGGISANLERLKKLKGG